MDPFQLRVLMGDVPLFWALLLPALFAGGARYVLQVASPSTGATYCFLKHGLHR